MKRRRRIVFMAILTTVMFLTTACGSVSPTQSSTSTSAPGVDPKTKTILIGASTPLSGTFSYYAQINQAAQAYFDMVNNQGGIDGWKIKYEVLDDAYLPPRNLANVKQLVEQDHVFGIVVNEGTPSNDASANYLKNTDVPVVGPAEGDPTLAKLPNYFVLMPNYQWEAGLAAEYAVKNLKLSRIAVLYEQDSVGIPGADGVEAVLKSEGIKPVAVLPYQANTVDFSPFVAKLDSAGAQAVIMWASNAAVASTLKAAAAVSFHPQWFAPFYVADRSTVGLTGNLINGVYFPSMLEPLTSNSEAVTSYKEAMKEYEPKTPIGGLSENGWAEASLFVYALRQMITNHTTITRPNLIKTLDSMNNVDLGVVQGVTFSAEHHDVGVQKEALLVAKNEDFYRLTGLIPFPSAALAVTSTTQ